MRGRRQPTAVARRIIHEGTRPFRGNIARARRRQHRQIRMNSGAQFESREFLREQRADFPERSTCTVAQRTDRTFVRGGFVAATGKWSHRVVIVQSETHLAAAPNASSVRSRTDSSGTTQSLCGWRRHGGHAASSRRMLLRRGTTAWPENSLRETDHMSPIIVPELHARALEAGTQRQLRRMLQQRARFKCRA